MTARAREFFIDWPKKRRTVVAPVFLPYLGCAGRCVFCAQEAQTGVRVAERDADQALAKCEAELKRRREPAEIAFYGGSFTAAPEKIWQKCLSFVGEMTDAGLASGMRCSTRPDALPAARLEELRLAGCGVVELGIQSFNDEALKLAGRRCDGATCLKAIAVLAERGFAASVHLMPGLPGVDGEIFLSDVATALAAGVRLFRFHPCLVLRGTELENRWRAGEYVPWDLDYALKYLGEAWALTVAAGAIVARTGLAPQEELNEAVLAGPVCPSLGSRARGGALLKIVSDKLAELGPSFRVKKILAPRFFSGFFFGWRDELAPRWRELGVEHRDVSWTTGDRATVICESR